jgi:hypothetical protein
MIDASVEYRSQPNWNRVGRVPFLTASGEVLVLADDPETGWLHRLSRWPQPLEVTCERRGAELS